MPRFVIHSLMPKGVEHQQILFDLLEMRSDSFVDAERR